MSEPNEPVNFQEWIAANRHLLKPPVGNKQLFPAGDDFITMVVGGPNQRTDYHVDPFEEFFYQIKGNIHVKVMTDKGPDRIDIREGEMWLLPRNLPHSPQRPEAGSIGLVIERVREEGTLEKFRWYCEQCDAMVHEVEVQVRDIVTDLPPLFQAFYDSTEARTCPRCGTVHPGKGDVGE
jgi:3-hydroxyanthranilate 3,4-dioxygenase